jgi:hypothetical protein
LLLIVPDKQLENVEVAGVWREMQILKQQHVDFPDQWMVAKRARVRPELLHHFGEIASIAPDNFREPASGTVAFGEPKVRRAAMLGRVYREAPR